MKKTITKEFKFDSAHRLYNGKLNVEENKKIFGKCYNTHGHGFKLFVTVSGEEDNGMIINFTKLKKIVNENIINKLDHQFLNDILPGIITCENMIDMIFGILDVELTKQNITLEKLKLYETETSFATLRR